MPQIRPEALEATLSRGIPAITWIHGDEPLLVQESADALRKAARTAGVSERLVFEVDRSFKPEAVAAEAGALSLFSTSKLVELRFGGKPGKENGEAIAEIVERLDDSVRLLASSARLDRGVTDSAWFTRIERAGVVLPVYPVERRELARWIAGRLARQRQRADAATLELIAERVEGNLLAAHQEVSKLGLLFPEGDLPADAARAAVLSVARYDAFDLVEAMLAGDRNRALRSVQGLRAEGEAPPLVLWSLADAIRSLLKLHAARQAGQALNQAMRAARIFGPRERLFEGALRRLPASVCETALQQAAQTDRIAKGVHPGDVWHAIERIVLTLSGVPLPKES